MTDEVTHLPFSSLSPPDNRRNPSPLSLRLDSQITPLPQYVRPLPSRLAEDDITVLRLKGALTIPPCELRDELLRAYVRYIDPFLPMLQLEDFLAAVEENSSTNQVSLLLLHAVMFAAAPFVDDQYFSKTGYESGKTARKDLFTKVKTLYDLDYEDDRITVIQALLLMTYWYGNPDDTKDPGHWAGIAISLARTTGLTEDISTSFPRSSEEKLHRRLWWSCYIRDRIVAVGTRTSVRIHDEELKVPMLDLDDFELNHHSHRVEEILGQSSGIRPGSIRVLLAEMCIQLAKLCVCIGDILTTQYSPSGSRGSQASQKVMTTRLVPTVSTRSTAEFVRCHQGLEQWKAELPSDLRYRASNGDERSLSGDTQVAHIHRALLAIVYANVVSTLHRPQATRPNPGLPSELQGLSPQKVQEAADEVTTILRDLHGEGLLLFLSDTAVTALLPAVVKHLINIKAGLHSREASLRDFQLCLRVLEIFREAYSSADAAFAVVNFAAQRSIPQVNMPSPACHEPKRANLDGNQFNIQHGSEGLANPPTESGPITLHFLMTPEERIVMTALASQNEVEGSACMSDLLPHMSTEVDFSSMDSQDYVDATTSEEVAMNICDSSWIRDLGLGQVDPKGSNSLVDELEWLNYVVCD